MFNEPFLVLSVLLKIKNMRKFSLFLAVASFTFFLLTGINDTDAYFFANSCVISNSVASWWLNYFPGPNNCNWVKFTATWTLQSWALETLTTDWTFWNNSIHDFASEQYWNLWYCRVWTWVVWTRTASQIFCPASEIYPNIWATWATGNTGAVWATWATGNTGAVWSMGLSAYDLALWAWFTGSEMDWVNSLTWPMGATGYIDIGTGIIQISPTISLTESTGSFVAPEGSGFYIPVVENQYGRYYLNGWWLLAILSFLIVLSVSFWIMWRIVFKPIFEVWKQKK